MSFYVLTFIDMPDAEWVSAADNTGVTPRVVHELLDGFNHSVVRGDQLDSILEWDRYVCRVSRTHSQLEFWPIDFIRKS